MPPANGSATAKRQMPRSPEPPLSTLLFYPEDRNYDPKFGERHCKHIKQKLVMSDLHPVEIRIIKGGFAADFNWAEPPGNLPSFVIVYKERYLPRQPAASNVCAKKPREEPFRFAKSDLTPQPRHLPVSSHAVTPISEDDFSEGDMVESDNEDSFATPPPSDNEPAITDESSVDSVPAILPSPADVRPATPRSALAPEQSGSALQPAACQQTVHQPGLKPRARRHPALLNFPPARDPLLVTILIRPCQPDSSLHSPSYTAVAREIKLISPPACAARRISGHGIALDFPPGTLTDPLLLLKTFCGIPVKASLPKDSQTHSGTIKGPFESADEVSELYSLHEENPPLQAVERIGKSSVYRLIFTNPGLPSTVRIFYNVHRIVPYFHRVLRCYKCHRLNHVAKACKSALTCGKCAQKGHSFKECAATEPCCANCGGSHDTASRQCPHWSYELKIRKSSARENIPVPQARANAARSYADVLSSKNQGTKTAVSAPAPATSISAEAFLVSIAKVMEICIQNIASPALIKAQVGEFLAETLGISLPATCA